MSSNSPQGTVEFDAPLETQAQSFGAGTDPNGDIKEFHSEKTARNYKWQSYALIFIIVLASVIGLGYFLKTKALSLVPKAGENKEATKSSNVARRKFDDKPPAREEFLDLPAPMTTAAPAVSPIPVAGLVPAPVTADKTATPIPVVTSNGQPQVNRGKGSIWVEAQESSKEPSGVATIAIPPAAPVTPTVMRPMSSYDTTTPAKVSDLAASLEGTRTKPSRATKVTNRNLALLAGSYVPCVMQTELVSSIAGFTSCIVMDNVYSDDGSTLVVDKGAQVTGEFRSAVRTGDARLFVLWNRIKTKNGVLIDIGSPGGDQVGGMGLPGGVDNHWWERIGAAFLLSSFQDFMALERAKAQASSTNGGTVVNTNGTNTVDASQSLAREVLKTTINIPPTIYKHRGDEIMIYVARDIQFDDVYKVVSTR
jgi:type IV secretion system protein VirB10